MQNTRVLVGFLIRAVVVGLAAAFLVVWWKPALLGTNTAIRARTMPPPRRSPAAATADRGHAKFCRLGGASGARGGEYLYRARGHGAHAEPPALNQLFGDFWPSYRQRVERSLGSGVIVDAARHHRDESARHRRCRFHPCAARRRPHRRRDHRRAGSRHGYRHSASDDRQAARHAGGALGHVAGRRHRARDRQSLRPESNRHPGHRQRHRAAVNWVSRPSRISSRPMPPSISATPAARSSTRTATWSASTPPC